MGVKPEYDGHRTMEYLSMSLAERLADLEHDDLIALLLHGSGAEEHDKLPGHLKRIASHCKAVNTCSIILQMVEDGIEIPLAMVVNLSVMSHDAGIDLPELQFYAAPEATDRVQ